MEKVNGDKWLENPDDKDFQKELSKFMKITNMKVHWNPWCSGLGFFFICLAFVTLFAGISFTVKYSW